MTKYSIIYRWGPSNSLVGHIDYKREVGVGNAPVSGIFKFMPKFYSWNYNFCDSPAESQ
jgi:hypothetical protein